ncbi:hypothetical protein [Arenimonas composti]|nr:hypothetical protein [Arenimonas composti]
MRRPSGGIKRLLFCLCLLAAGAAPARTVHLDVAHVRSGVGSLDGVQARLQWRDGEPQGALEVRVAAVDFPLLAFRATNLAWRCPLQRPGAGEWVCEGPLAGAGADGRRLSLQLSPVATRAVLDGGGQRISYENQAASPALSRIELRGVPVAWLQGFLEGLWADGHWGSGTVAGRIDVHAPAQGLRVDTDLRLAGVGIETPDGWLAAAGVDAGLEVVYRDDGSADGSGRRIDIGLRTSAGELLVDTFYVPLPESPVDIAVAAESGGDGSWRLPRLRWIDGEVLQAEGSALVDAAGGIAALDLQLHAGDLATVRDRYLSGVLAPAGFADLVLGGSVDARLRLAEGQLQALAISPHAVTAIDPRQRFTLAGVDGDLDWQRAGSGPAGHLRWGAGALFGIGLGGTRFDFEGAGGQLRLAAPAHIAALGGEIRIDGLVWSPPGGGEGTRFELGLALDRLDLGSLSQRLGWPPFTGQISGRIPAARYADNVLALDGGLQMQLFGGRVGIDGVVLERPFGAAPSLSADVAIDDIDLEPLTAAFGFGAITGRLDGRIAGLRMIDWSPVRFDAFLQTDPAWNGRQRISYRAVEDITRVGGGGGLMGGLQTQALKFFDDFGYRRIGLGCRLRDNVCDMSGVDSAGDGYTIVQGAGLPRIQVVGFRRRVDWPTLVDRLQAATEGQAPVID